MTEITNNLNNTTFTPCQISNMQIGVCGIDVVLPGFYSPNNTLYMFIFGTGIYVILINTLDSTEILIKIDNKYYQLFSLFISSKYILRNMGDTSIFLYKTGAKII